MKRLAALAGALLTGACLSVGNANDGIFLDFDFNAIGSTFTSGAADFPAARAAEVGAIGDTRLLPAAISSTVQGLYLSGTNVSGDLFLFQKRRLTGLTPNHSYQAYISVEYVTSYQSGCTSGPGPNTVIKAGVLADEPVVTTDGQGVFRMNIDKGAGTAKGLYTVGGDIRNGLALCPGSGGSFALQSTLAQTQATPLVTDAEGGFWLFFGTQSSFVGSHEIWFTRLRLTLK